MPAAASGSAPAAAPRSATAATIRKASASAATRPAIAPPSRCGSNASSAISTTRWNWARATSRLRCAGCADSRAKALPTNSTSTALSTPPPGMPAGSICMMRPERHNAVKVLLFLDVGGSMEDHVRICEELFSACRAEFKHLEHFYFHNCVYDGGVAGQPSPLERAHLDARPDAQIRRRLPTDLRRRRDDEPLRNPPAAAAASNT